MIRKRVVLLVLLAIAVLVLTSGCFLFQNRPPTAAFVVHYGVDEEDPMVVDLDATPSTDPDDDPIVDYMWVFGDDSVEIITPLTSTKLVHIAKITVRYPNEGTYNVQLVVRDDKGASSEPVTGEVILPNIPVAPTE